MIYHWLLSRAVMREVRSLRFFFSRCLLFTSSPAFRYPALRTFRSTHSHNSAHAAHHNGRQIGSARAGSFPSSLRNCARSSELQHRGSSQLHSQPRLQLLLARRALRMVDVVQSGQCLIGQTGDVMSAYYSVCDLKIESLAAAKRAHLSPRLLRIRQ